MRAQDQEREVDDVGAAVAAFVAANLSALQGTRVTPHTLSCLERQLGGVARLSSDWCRAPLHERQAYFEQMAVLAVLVAEARRRPPRRARRRWLMCSTPRVATCSSCSDSIPVC